MRLIGFIVVLLVGFTGFARAGFEESVAAYNRGDYVTAYRELEPLADQGIAEAQFKIGVLTAEGRGVARNYREAARWLRLAAEQGHSKAQFNLALMYKDGVGIPADRAEAAHWFRQAAENGVLEAQFIIGAMYGAGDGVRKDEKEAVAWFGKAADRGHPAAQHGLGMMFANGRGVLQNMAAAEYWFRKAADQGSAAAQYRLGLMYSEGANVTRDLVQAFVWYSLAIANDRSDVRREASRRKLASVAANLSRQDLSRAQGLTALWANDGVAILVAAAPALPHPPPPPKPVFVQGVPVGQTAAVAAVRVETKAAQPVSETATAAQEAPIEIVVETPVEDPARKAADGETVVETAALAETGEAADAVAAEAAAVGEKLDVAAATTDSVATVEVTPHLSPDKVALLTEDEILTRIIGNSMTGFARGGWWTEYYAPDGTIRGKWRSQRYLAKWSVDRGLMCFDYAIDGRNFCLMLAVTKDQVFVFQEDGSGGDRSSRLLAGNPQNL